jgi:YjbE family integral membrane protein
VIPPPRIFIDGLSIVLIDLLLAGDNALVIAMAVRALPREQRRIGTTLGALAAVLLRIAITFAAAQVLNIEYIKLLGGAFVIWIAVKVFADASSPQRVPATQGHFLKAIGFIVFADITMSIDNVLAIAGASRGSIPLIVFGLGLSIPFVIFSSGLLVRVMDRYPATLYLGAAILGKVGAEMTLTDGFVIRTLHPTQGIVYAAEAIAIAGVLIVSTAISKRKTHA